MLAEPSPAPRAECLRCRRPVAHCYCEHLAPIANTTEVVFLQHPRESRVAIGTCRMAHLALQRSELHLGVTFGSHPRVRALADARDGTVAVLYPGETACEPEALGAGPPATLIVLDGTWHQVRTMWRRNPMLHALPRIGFVPSAPGNYRIRREPAPHCLATVEAVVEILGRLDGDRAALPPHAARLRPDGGSAAPLSNAETRRAVAPDETPASTARQRCARHAAGAP